MESTIQKCNVCGEDKELLAFRQDARCKTGYKLTCMACEGGKAKSAKKDEDREIVTRVSRRVEPVSSSQEFSASDLTDMLRFAMRSVRNYKEQVESLQEEVKRLKEENKRLREDQSFEAPVDEFILEELQGLGYKGSR